MRTKPRALLVEMYLSVLVIAGNVHENPELEVISLFCRKIIDLSNKFLRLSIF